MAEKASQVEAVSISLKKRLSQNIRPLGALERYQSALHLLDLYRGTAVTCRYKIPHALTSADNQSLLEEIFENAIARTVLQHPLLQVGLVKEDSRSPIWVPLAEVDLGYHIRWQIFDSKEGYDAAFEKAYIAEIETKFLEQETRPGWKVILTRSVGGTFVDAVFNFNHPNSDGMGGKIFHETLIRALVSIPVATTVEQLRESVPALHHHLLQVDRSSDRFPPSQDDLTSWKLSLGYLISRAWHIYRPAFFWKKQGTVALWAPFRTSPYKTALRCITFENNVVQNILAACRSHGTTLTGLLHALTLVSLTTHLPKEKISGLASTTALNTRRYVPHPHPKHPWLDLDKTICNYVSSTQHEFKPALVADFRQLIQGAGSQAPKPGSPAQPEFEEKIWSIATMLKKDIQDRVNLGTKDDIIGVMQYVWDYRRMVMEIANKPRFGSWVVTNIGVLDGSTSPAPQDSPDETTWSIEQARFSLSAVTTGAVISVCPVSVKGGRLSIDFCWQDCVLDSELAGQIVDTIKGWLSHLGTVA